MARAWPVVSGPQSPRTCVWPSGGRRRAGRSVAVEWRPRRPGNPALCALVLPDRPRTDRPARGVAADLDGRRVHGRAVADEIQPSTNHALRGAGAPGRDRSRRSRVLCVVLLPGRLEDVRGRPGRRLQLGRTGGLGFGDQRGPGCQAGGDPGNS